MTYRSSGITLVQTLMVLALLALLVWVLLPHVIICDSQKTRTLSNMRFLHMATRQMALDREIAGHTNNSTGILVYAMSTNSPEYTVFLSSVNFTNTPAGGVLNPKVNPYRDKSFIVFRKEGDGAILQPRQVGLTNVIGSYVPLCY